MHIRGRAFALFLALLVDVGFSTTSSAQTPVTVDWLTDLKFGKVAASVDGGGTITIPSSADSRSITGQLIDFGGTVKRGKFRINGQPRAWVVITMPSTIVVQKGTGSYTMTISNLTLSTENPVRLNNQGTKNVFFGATLTVITDQRQGTYQNSSFVINVDYL